MVLGGTFSAVTNDELDSALGKFKDDIAQPRVLPMRRPYFSGGDNKAFTTPDGNNALVMSLEGQRPPTGRIWCVRSFAIFDLGNTNATNALFPYLCIGSVGAPSMMDTKVVNSQIPFSQTFTGSSLVVNHSQDLYVILVGTNNTSAKICFSGEVDDYPESSFIAQRM